MSNNRGYIYFNEEEERKRKLMVEKRKKNQKIAILIGVSVLASLIIYILFTTYPKEYKVRLVQSGLEIVEVNEKYLDEPELVVPKRILGLRVISIGSEAFRNCDSITKITISEGIKSIGFNAFVHCSNLTSIEIPNSVSSIGMGAFYNCKSLTSVIFGENSKLTIIDKDLFYNCGSLTSINIPNSVISIESCAFYFCTKLSSIEMSNNLTSISYSAFRNCVSLNKVILPESVTSIDSGAFLNCKMLTTVMVDSVTPPKIVLGTYGTFDDLFDPLKIYVPSQSLEAYKSQRLWGELSDKIYPQSVIDESGFAIDSGVLIQYLGNARDIVIPNNVTSIGSYAFFDGIDFNTLTIPSSVISIGDEAFFFAFLFKIIIIENTTPPTLGQNYFWLFDIYVPPESLDAYKSASGWSEHADNIYAKE